jgi:capsular exopolysaccharide synthesis family protein
VDGKEAGTGGEFRSWLGIVRDQWSLIAALALLASGVALGTSVRQQKQFEASANVLFRRSTAADAFIGQAPIENPIDYSGAGTEMDTNVGLLEQSSIGEQVSASHPEFALSAGEIESRVSSAQIGDSNLASVTARDTEPGRARDIANAWVDAFLAIRVDADRALILSSLNSVQKQLAESSDSAEQRELRQLARNLEVVANLQNGGAQVVRRADLPGAPVAPRPVRSGFLGLIGGLILGVGAAFLRHTFDRRLKRPEEVEVVSGLPSLGVIPSGLGSSDGPRLATSGDREELEAYRTVRTNLQYVDLDRTRRVLLITSPSSGEGKTTNSANLAVALARAGNSVAIIDADLRRPSIASLMGIPPEPGLSTLLAGLADVPVWRAALPDDASVAGRLRVLAAGPIPPNPVELLSSQRMSQLIEDARGRFDYVIIDTPPVLPVSDAIPVAQRTDAVILVARLHKTLRDDVKRAVKSLAQVGIRPIGVIVTAARGRDTAYGGSYYYGAEQPASDEFPHLPAREALDVHSGRGAAVSRD